MPKVHIVDAIMGKGKTSAAINFMRDNPDRRYLYITPFLSEVDRIQKSIPNFKTPAEQPTKKKTLKELIRRRYNIVSTHSLFQQFDQELIQICRDNDYTLVMDEVAEVVDLHDISRSDVDILKKDYVYIEENGIIHWKPDKDDYSGRFSREKILCDLDSLVEYNNNIMLWMFPIKAFDAFREVFILTYLFDAQLQKYYYDFYDLEYDYLYVAGDSIENYHFAAEKTADVSPYDYKSLITIEDNEKLNRIGSIDLSDLSKSWYIRNDGSENMKVLKNNLYNFFRNKCKAPAAELYWTTFNNYQHKLKGNGYSSYKKKARFLPCNARATNDFRDCWAVAYAVNRYPNPIIVNFFASRNIHVDQDKYALSEMLQFIWRSRVRNGETIRIYIPSVRMRNLLEKWIDELDKDL